MKSLAWITVAAVTIIAFAPPAHAASAAGAGIEVNGKYIGGFTITWDGETREDLVQQLSNRYITFERDYKIPISAKDPNVAAINGRIRLLSKIRGDRQVMGRTQALQLVKRDGKWFAERESLKRALKADNGDETLERWLSKSDLVAVGTIASDPVAIVGEKGVPHYACRFKTSDVCKGDADLNGKTLDLGIVRFEIEEKDHHPLIRKDAECILFLRNAGTEQKPSWETADFWFGVQHPFPWMVDSLKRLEKRKEGVSKLDSNFSSHPPRLVNNTPKGFEISHGDAVSKARPFFVENPFALQVFADDRYYFVDVASSKTVSAERAKKRGVWIDGRTGEVCEVNVESLASDNNLLEATSKRLRLRTTFATLGHIAQAQFTPHATCWRAGRTANRCDAEVWPDGSCGVGMT